MFNIFLCVRVRGRLHGRHLDVSLHTDLLRYVLLGDEDHGCTARHVQAYRVRSVMQGTALGNIALTVARTQPGMTSELLLVRVEQDYVV